MDKNREIKVIPGFSGFKSGTICFKTAASMEDVYNFDRFAFEDGPGLMAPSAIRLLYERMVLGSPFPGTLILNRVESFQNVLAAALFIDPSLVHEDRCGSFVYSLDLITRVGDVGSAHVPQTHTTLISEVQQTFEGMPDSTLEEDYNRLHSAASMVSEYLRHGSLGYGEGPVASDERPFEIIEKLEDFVVVSSDHSRSILDFIYREGFLCGVWFPEEYSKPVLFKKSSLVPYFDLSKTGKRLDKKEFGVSVSSAGWMQNFDPSMVTFPVKNPADGTECDGTSLSQDDIIDVARDVYEQDRREL